MAVLQQRGLLQLASEFACSSAGARFVAAGQAPPRRSAQWQRQRRRQLHEVFADAHQRSREGTLDTTARNAYADASHAKMQESFVRDGAKWCWQRLLPVAGRGCGEPLRLLDIGSCSNPLLGAASDHAETTGAGFDLEITALDVCPRHPSVWQCDALELKVSPAGSRPSSRGRNLLALPAVSFDICIFSMVLHHWTLESQARCLRTAHALLAENGLLLIIENRAWCGEAVVDGAGFRLEATERVGRTPLRGLEYERRVSAAHDGSEKGR
eukprot:TRINITY_DN51152_c0_g1_i1.p1 TRINITY_DN51152_c0_g1~~TRINITY_DN51152_c0_g1_i1.p1  ORF type:complete len:282 (+),score=52.43 TRINITY_DN51152_c0_g1_i1:41-847(+)